MESGYIIVMRTEQYTKAHYLCYDIDKLASMSFKEYKHYANRSGAAVLEDAEFIASSHIKMSIVQSQVLYPVIMFQTRKAAEEVEYHLRKWCKKLNDKEKQELFDDTNPMILTRKMKIDELGSPDFFFIMKS